MTRNTIWESKPDIISVIQSFWDLASTALAYMCACTQTSLSTYSLSSQACLCSTGFSIISFVDVPSSHSPSPWGSILCFCKTQQQNISTTSWIFYWSTSFILLRRQQNLFQQPKGFFSYSYCLRHCINVSLLKQSYPIWISLQTFREKKEKTLSQAAHRLLVLLFTDISLVVSL